MAVAVNVSEPDECGTREAMADDASKGLEVSKAETRVTPKAS
jgi:hypothetical protein